jgi:hypothetical protein
MPDPLPPANPLGLVSLAVIGLVAVIGELVKRFSQLWGSNNSRAEKTAIWEKYAFWRIAGSNSPWYSTSNSYPILWAVDSLSPQRVAWPGQNRLCVVPPVSGVGGQIVGYTAVSKSKPLADLVYDDLNSLSIDVGSTGADGCYISRTQAYEFSNSFAASTALATWAGNSNIPTQPQENPYEQDSVPLVPITGLSPLDRLPLVPAAAAPVAQKAPLKQAQSPTAEAVPVVPKVAASPALTATAQVTRSNFYMPDRLPAPLAPPATKTRSTTGAGTLVAPAALPVPQTATDLRKYGSQVITAIGVRPDLASIAEEVGRMERKMGIMLEGADQIPDWFEPLLGPLLNQLKDAILDALVVDVPATTYEFVAPCDKDENDDPLVHEADIEAADYQPAIVARLDAIAEAMGVLKGWKSPTCRTSSPRSNVTVTAFEFNPEA